VLSESVWRWKLNLFRSLGSKLNAIFTTLHSFHFSLSSIEYDHILTLKMSVKRKKVWIILPYTWIIIIYLFVYQIKKSRSSLRSEKLSCSFESWIYFRAFALHIASSYSRVSKWGAAKIYLRLGKISTAYIRRHLTTVWTLNGPLKWSYQARAIIRHRVWPFFLSFLIYLHFHFFVKRGICVTFGLTFRDLSSYYLSLILSSSFCIVAPRREISF